jgi:hypothetical protein
MAVRIYPAAEAKVRWNSDRQDLRPAVPESGLPAERFSAAPAFSNFTSGFRHTFLVTATSFAPDAQSILMPQLYG